MDNWYKHSRLFLILIGLLVIVLVVPVFGAMRIAQAESVTLAGFKVTYDGRIYDDVSDTSTFAYTVCATGSARHDLSHFTIEIPICYSESDVVASDPTGYIFGYDPKTGIRGIKWNFGLSSTPGTCRTYSFTLQGNIPEGTVEVGVKAGGGWRIVHKGEITGPACPTPTPTIPDAPINLTATAISSSQIDLNWDDNSNNELGFKIERKTGAGGTYSQIATVGPNVEAYPNTGLSPDTTYYYRVRAYNAAGDSAYSNEASAHTPPLPPLPNPPSNLSATAISSSQIDLSWTDNSDSELGFKIERKTGAGGTYSQIATVGPNVEAYPNTGLSPDTTYYYRVRAYNAAGNSAYSNEASAHTPPLPPLPNPPSNLSATAISPSQIDLSWDDNSDNELGFKIERKTAGGTYSQIASVGPNVTTYPDAGLSPNTTYYYGVRAYNAAGDSPYAEDSATTLERIEGCFIATAAYGTPLAEEIEVLRQFRDEYLLTNPPGRLFASVYYRSSPPLADFIDDHPALKPLVRAGLSPAVALTTVAVNTTSAEKLAIVGGLALVSLALALWLRRRAGGVNM